jgi:superfamily II DNA/RNA helicase
VKELRERGIEGVEAIDGGSKVDRGEVIARFSPYYNGTTSAAVGKEIRILISTDVLSEGLNLQDATRLINFDIHWNPVRLMQRIGRVDRRLNPEVEAKLVADHPERKALRGRVKYWNFLPPAELNRLLTLYTRVTHKILRISETFGIEGQKLLRPDDHLNALKEFNQAYEGRLSTLEEMRLEYRAALAADPSLEARLAKLPQRLFSGREHLPRGLSRGVFFCYALPARAAVSAADAEPEWTTADGHVEWYLYDPASGKVVERAEDVHPHVKTTVDTPRCCRFDRADLVAARKAVEKHIKNTYLKQVDAPVGIKPELRCWMELNEG